MMKLNRYIIVLFVTGTILLPETSSAWLICDPCCECKPPKAIGIDLQAQGSKDVDVVASQVAVSYARAGVHFFQGLDALERSDIEKANKTFNSFGEQILETMKGVYVLQEKHKNAPLEEFTNQFSDLPRLNGFNEGTNNLPLDLAQYAEQLSEVADKTKKLVSILSSSQLPYTPQVTELGMEWAKVQVMANSLAETVYKAGNNLTKP